MAPGHDPFSPLASAAADAPEVDVDPAVIGPHGKYHLPDAVLERFSRLGATDEMLEEWRANMEAATYEERAEALGNLPPDGEEYDTLLADAIRQAVAERDAADLAEEFTPDGESDTVLPDSIAAGFLANGATAEETQALADRWADGTDEDRAWALGLVAEFTPEDWTEFVTSWRDVIASGILQQEVDDDTGESIPWLPPLYLNGTRPDEGERAEVPDGHVRVEVSVDNGDDGYSLGADVPEEHQAALAFLADVEEEGITAGDRARLVLAAEMTRPASKRRKSILDAVTETLGEAEVIARTVE